MGAIFAHGTWYIVNIQWILVLLFLQVLLSVAIPTSEFVRESDLDLFKWFAVQNPGIYTSKSRALF